MKLLAQFYACLAITVFIAVIGGIEAKANPHPQSQSQAKRLAQRSTDAGNHGGLGNVYDAQGNPIQPQISEPKPEKVRRSVPVAAINELHDDGPKPPESLRQRRNAQNPEDIPEKMMPKPPQRPQVNEEHKRVSRQIPGGGNMPNPEDFAKHIPSPGGK